MAYSLVLDTQDHIDAVKAQMQSPPPGGFDVAAMRDALRVMEVLDTARPGVALSLKDTDYAVIRRG